jgi:hypothetical protein
MALIREGNRTDAGNSWRHSSSPRRAGSIGIHVSTVESPDWKRRQVLTRLGGRSSGATASATVARSSAEIGSSGAGLPCSAIAAKKSSSTSSIGGGAVTPRPMLVPTKRNGEDLEAGSFRDLGLRHP